MTLVTNCSLPSLSDLLPNDIQITKLSMKSEAADHLLGGDAGVVQQSVVPDQGPGQAPLLDDSRLLRR